MNPSPLSSKLFIFLVITNILMFGACVNPDESNVNSNQNNTVQNIDSEKTNPSNDNIEKLLEIVLLPEVPEEVVWKEVKLGTSSDRVPGPTDRKIIAVLQYTPENATKIVNLVEKNKQPEMVEVDVESWFPEVLTAKAQLSGSETLKGIAYGANQFYNMPYGNGKITRIEGTDYFILELFTT